MLEVLNLRHFYGDHEALKGISFEVTKGEIFGLLGPNGSGKSTLFRILSTLFPPSDGTIRLNGADLCKDYVDVRKQIGVVFQFPSLDVKLTVMENLKCQGAVYGLRGENLTKRAEAMLEHLGLTARRDDYVSVLSGGMKRRVELAKGLMHEPTVLFLDEPATGLDPGARMDLWRYLEDLRREQNVTVLVTTHLMDEADRCDRIAILDRGKIVKAGEPEKLKQELGGDILEIKSSRLEDLNRQVKEKFGLTGRLSEDKLQLEHEHGASFIARLVESFPGRIESVTFRKPTLEDVFVQHTGHRFWNEEKKEAKK